jgi:glycosyltransferase involved in cell wall biosynthesis
MITYNHENFIGEAIDSVLMQKSDLELELVIGEDCSTDRTRAICEDYAGRYPDTVRLLPSLDKNVGMIPNFIRTLESCTGKYIAINEGDDYWTDPNKLQKQVGFLEANPDYSVSFHAAENLEMSTGSMSTARYECENGFRTFSAKDAILIGGALMTTNSIVFRSQYIRNLPDWVRSAPTGDFALSLLLSDKGKVAYFDDAMCVYRHGVAGSWSTRMLDLTFAKNLIFRTVKMLISYNQYTNNRHIVPVIRSLSRIGIFLLSRYWYRISTVWNDSKKTDR